MYLVMFVLVTCLPVLYYATGALLCTSVATHDIGPVTHGTNVTLNCSWPVVNEDVDNSNLTWYRLDSSEEFSPISSQNGEAIWQIAGLDNGVEFLCAGQNRTSGEAFTCTLMPFVVSPSVLVESLDGDFVLGKKASLVCMAEGLPLIAGYRWYVNGVEDEGLRSKLRRAEDDKNVTIERLVASDNGSVITCEAYVPSGLKANSSLVIDLKEPSLDKEGTVTVSTLWIFIACAATGGIPVTVLMVVCLAWCVCKTCSGGKQSKKRSQSRRHIVLNEEQNEARDVEPLTVHETTLSERRDNGLSSNLLPTATGEVEDDGTNPPHHKPAPPPALHFDPDNTYVNTPAPLAATLPNPGHRPMSPTYYSTPRPSKQRKKTEYENVASQYEADSGNHNGNIEPNTDVYENVAGQYEADSGNHNGNIEPNADVYENVASQYEADSGNHNGNIEPNADVYENVAPPRPLSPKPTLVHTASLPNFLT